MSIYGSTFTLDDFTDDEEPHLGEPYIYAGSHRTGNPEMRGGSFDLAEAVPWCTLNPFLRVGVTEAAHSRRQADILLDFAQVKALADYLAHYVERVESGEWREWGDHELEESLPEGKSMDEYLSGYVARPSDLNRLAERQAAARA